MFTIEHDTGVQGQENMSWRCIGFCVCPLALLTNKKGTAAGISTQVMDVSNSSNLQDKQVHFNHRIFGFCWYVGAASQAAGRGDSA